MKLFVNANLHRVRQWIPLTCCIVRELEMLLLNGQLRSDYDLNSKYSPSSSECVQRLSQIDDIVNEGILTLLNAIDKFEPERGVKFETYVRSRSVEWCMTLLENRIGRHANIVSVLGN